MTDYEHFVPPDTAGNGNGTQRTADTASGNADRRQLKERRRILRIVIQTIFFLLAPSLFMTAFNGIKQFFTMIHQGKVLAMSGFFAMLIALCVFTMLFGRFFCGYACAFGSLGDFIFFLSKKVQKKTGRKLSPLPEKAERVIQHVPYLLLLLIMFLCATGIYEKMTGWSPWEVFSLITAFNFHFGGAWAGVILLLMIMIGMAMEPRFFCRFLCPMGAVFRLLPVFPWALLKRDKDNCIKGCSACQKLCPVNHALGAGQNAGDCIRCGECTDVCPRGNISIGRLSSVPIIGSRQTLPDRQIFGNELWLTAGKAVLLFIIAAVLGAVRFL